MPKLVQQYPTKVIHQDQYQHQFSGEKSPQQQLQKSPQQQPQQHKSPQHQQQQQKSPQQQLHPKLLHAPSKSQYNLNLGAYKTSNQHPQLHHRSHKSVYKSLRISRKSANSSSANSPPMVPVKSKFSKSRRFDPHEVPPLSCCDYLWLLVYFICLYAFYAAFWYGLWLAYIATTNPRRPRVDHVDTSRQNFSEAVLLEPSEMGESGHFERGAIQVNKTKLLMSMTEEQRQALTVIKCNDAMRIAKELAGREGQ